MKPRTLNQRPCLFLPLAMLGVLLGGQPALAAEPHLTQNLILVTLDGVRNPGNFLRSR